MKMRSTGLGDTELALGIAKIRRLGDCLILEGRTTEPVKWHVRIAMSYRDMWQMTKLMINPKNILFLIWKTLRFKSAEKISWPDKF